MTSLPNAVYLVEDHTADEQEGQWRGRYFAKVYLGRVKAVAGAQYGAAVYHRGALIWNHDHAGWPDGTPASTIVPLAVFRDQGTEPARAL